MNDFYRGSVVAEQQVAVVIVTYNRRDLLLRCLAAIRDQTVRPHWTVIVDNASSDGTYDALVAHGWIGMEGLRYERMGVNVGGAGGFSRGIEEACRLGASWLWLMDDDAEPSVDALQHLFAQPLMAQNIYASVPVCDGSTAWRITLLNGGTSVSTNRVADLPAYAEVESHPFLGFLIHRELISRIGLPDAGFFIAADDVEYSLRARRAGASIRLVSASRIRHPKAAFRTIQLLGHSLVYLSLPPWKRYYDTRNRILIARRYHGRMKLLTRALPGTLIRMMVATVCEPGKLLQAWAHFAGTVDGLLGLDGRRHQWWRIQQ